jgi:site-specific recombinase XerC
MCSYRGGIRVLFDWVVVGQIVPFNPASSVRGRGTPCKGKTPVLTAEEARAILNAIDITTPVGLRDRALSG